MKRIATYGLDFANLRAEFLYVRMDNNCVQTTPLEWRSSKFSTSDEHKLELRHAAVSLGKKCVEASARKKFSTDSLLMKKAPLERLLSLADYNKSMSWN